MIVSASGLPPGWSLVPIGTLWSARFGGGASYAVHGGAVRHQQREKAFAAIAHGPVDDGSPSIGYRYADEPYAQVVQRTREHVVTTVQDALKAGFAPVEGTFVEEKNFVAVLLPVGEPREAIEQLLDGAVEDAQRCLRRGEEVLEVQYGLHVPASEGRSMLVNFVPTGKHAMAVCGKLVNGLGNLHRFHAWTQVATHSLLRGEALEDADHRGVPIDLHPDAENVLTGFAATRNGERYNRAHVVQRVGGVTRFEPFTDIEGAAPEGTLVPTFDWKETDE